MVQNLLLSTLPPDEQERLQPYLEPVTLQMKENLCLVDEPIPAVWFPDNAVTSTLVQGEDGSTIEVGLMGIEGMVGLSLLFDVRESNTTVIVQVPGTATKMKAEHFMRHVVAERNSYLFKLLQRYTNAFMGMVAQSAACNSLHSVEERFCRWILMTHDRVADNEIPLTQEFLSIMLGVRRPTVSMTAGIFKQAGMINYTRGNVTILDREGLKESTCECYDIINKQMDRVFDGLRLKKPRS